MSYGSENMHEFAQAHLAPHAWAAIDDALNMIRNCLKHGVVTHEQCLTDVQYVLSTAKARLDE